MGRLDQLPRRSTQIADLKSSPHSLLWLKIPRGSSCFQSFSAPPPAVSRRISCKSRRRSHLQSPPSALLGSPIRGSGKAATASMPRSRRPASASPVLISPTSSFSFPQTHLSDLQRLRPRVDRSKYHSPSQPHSTQLPCSQLSELHQLVRPPPVQVG